MQPRFRSALVFLFSSLACGAEVSPTPAAIDYKEQPTPKFEYGLVRVWNAKSGPAEGAGHIPEAKLSDTLVVELKNIDQWLCQNLDAGAWENDPKVLNADPLVRRIFEERKFWPAVRAGKWLEQALKKAAEAQPTGDAEPADAQKNLKLLAALKTAIDLDESLLPAKDETGAPLDPAKPNDANRIVEACQKAAQLVKELRKEKATQFILLINNLPLPSLPVKPQESRTSWRSASERKEEGAYTWWQIKLRASDDPDSEKGWSDLMRTVKPHFSLQSQVSLALPNQLVPLPTNVTPTAEDSRCRFVFIATTEAPRSEKTLAKGDAVYPLDVRERTSETRKAEVVEIDNENTAAPYIVHFSEIGGTKRYGGKDLARLPPDPVPAGVVRVWNGNKQSPEWEAAQKDEMPTAKVGDQLVVEVRNFDGWLCNQIDQGLLRDDPLLQKASPKLKEFIGAKGFLAAVKVGGAVSDISNNTQKTSTDIVRQLHRAAAENPDLATLVFPPLGPEKPRKIESVQVQKAKPADKTSAPPAPEAVEPEKTTAQKEAEKKEAEKKKAEQEETEKKEKEKETQDEKTAQNFLAPYREAHSLVGEFIKAKLRSLNLTINDLPLGITPDSADFTPINESRRPPGNRDEDTYHWLKFSFAPKPGARATENEEKTADDPFSRLLDKPSFTMPSKVTLTLKSGAETLSLPTAVTPQAKDKRCQFGLIGIQTWKFGMMTGVFLLVAASLVFCAAKTDILRDPCRRRPEGVEPVSLSRTQMAFWFVVIAAAFLFLWVTTGNIGTINTTCLVLLAIGTTTALSADAISKRDNRQKDLSDALQKTPHEMLKMTPKQMKDAIIKRRGELDIAPGALTSEELKQANKILDRHEKEIDCFLKKQPTWMSLTVYSWGYRLRTVGEDLLTEEAGTYDFHRFQMLAWTVLLGVVFVVKVFHDRVMPVFDANILLLMGISSGAYLGFKKVATEREEKAKDKSASDQEKTVTAKEEQKTGPDPAPNK